MAPASGRSLALIVSQQVGVEASSSKLTSNLAVQVTSSAPVVFWRTNFSTVVVSRASTAPGPCAIIRATARLPALRCSARIWPCCVSGSAAGAGVAVSAAASVSLTCSFTPRPRRAAPRR